MAGESDEAHFALFFRELQRFGRTTRPDEERRIVIERDAVDLPKVEVVGLEPPQGLFEHSHGEVLIAPVRANLGHKKDMIAEALERFAHPLFGFATMVLPAVVEEGDAAIDGVAD